MIGLLLRIHWEPCRSAIIDQYPGRHPDYLLSIFRTGCPDGRNQYKDRSHLIHRNLKHPGNLLDLPTPLTLSCSRHTRMSDARSRNILLSVIRESMVYDPEMSPRIYLATLDTELCQSFDYRCIIVIKVYEKTGTTLHGRFESQHLCFGSKKTIAGATVIVEGAHVGTGISVDAKP